MGIENILLNDAIPFFKMIRIVFYRLKKVKKCRCFFPSSQ